MTAESGREFIGLKVARLGDRSPRRLSMKSKYVPETPVKKPNQWRETTISEHHLRDCIAPLLKQLRFVQSTEYVDRVILSDPKDHTYKLTYAISRKE